MLVFQTVKWFIAYWAVKFLNQGDVLTVSLTVITLNILSQNYSKVPALPLFPCPFYCLSEMNRSAVLQTTVKPPSVSDRFNMVFSGVEVCDASSVATTDAQELILWVSLI